MRTRGEGLGCEVSIFCLSFKRPALSTPAAFVCEVAMLGKLMIVAAFVLMFVSLRNVGAQSIRNGNIVFQIVGLIAALVLGIAGIFVALLS
jgi:hypothetical protein